MAKGMDRRTAIKGMALGGVAAALGWHGIPVAFAAQGRVVIGTWGGDYAQLLTKNIETPLLKPQGIEVVQDQASDAPRRSKLMAEKRLPRGTSDVQALTAGNMYEMNQNDVLLKLDYSKLPNAVNLKPIMKYPYGVGSIYSGMVIVVNPAEFPKKPTSFKELFDPKHGSKHGVIDIQYQFMLTAASMAATNGASMTDYDKAKELLMAIKKAGARVYPTNEAFAQALKSGEISIGMMWKARTVQWQNAGIACEGLVASEGIPIYMSGFAIPKNAPNKDGAYAYLNASMDKSAQRAFAIDMGYNPTINGADVPADVQKRIGFNPDEEKRLMDLPYAELAKNDAALKEWWDKVFKG
jgi:putative spermidine/putrescine transport system substrate-binding protein